MGFDLPILPARPSSSTPTRTPIRTLDGLSYGSPYIARPYTQPVHYMGPSPFAAGSVLVGLSLVLRIAPALVRISIWELVGPHNSRPAEVIGVDVVTDTDTWVMTESETNAVELGFL